MWANTGRIISRATVPTRHCTFAVESSVEDSRLASQCAGTGLCVDRQSRWMPSPTRFRGNLLCSKKSLFNSPLDFHHNSEFFSAGSEHEWRPGGARGFEGGCKAMKRSSQVWLPILLICLAAVANAQSFRVQCPTSTITHPSALHDNNLEPTYTGPTSLTMGAHGYLVPSANVNGAIKCQQISGGDGYSTMGDGTQTYMFSFGPLSGLSDIAHGLPGTQFPSVLNTVYTGTFALQPGAPATAATPSNGGSLASGFGNYNGAIGLASDLDSIAA